MRKALVLLSALLAASAWAQEKQEEKLDATRVRVYQVNPGSVARIREALNNIGIISSAQADVLIVRTSANLAPAVDEIVAKLNTASTPKNIELTFYILQGSREPVPDGGPLPAELQPAVNQIKTAFAYQNFRLLDTAFLRGRSGENGYLTGLATVAKDAPLSSTYDLRLHPSVSSDGKPPTIRIDNLRFSFTVPVRPGPGSSSYNFQNIRLEADLDLKEGQKVVIGKTGIDGGQSALILIATGKVVE